MKTIDISNVTGLALASPMKPPREMKHAHDWGDQETVWAHTKHHGATIGSPDDHFGVYLGFHKDVGYVVALKDIKSRFTGGEVFKTIGEMKQRWQLD
jgi:hypothetical protein